MAEPISKPPAGLGVPLQELEAWDRRHLWHPFSQMGDYRGVIVESAEGCWLTTVDGRRLLDATSSLWCNVHGHAHPRLDAAVRRQLDRVAHVTGLGMSHPTSICLAKRLTELAPPGLEHVFFSSDGASAVEAAMKMAFQYWRQISLPEPERNLFLAVGGAYHGDTLGACSVGGVSQFHSLFQSLLFPVLRGPSPDRRSCTPSGPDSLAACLASYEALLETHRGRVAAIIVEPLVQAAAGMVMHPTGFLRGLSELAVRYNTLLIADEVAVGMGRTGALFACQHESVAPDLLCIGKGLSGGYLPISATMCQTRVWQAFLDDGGPPKTFFHGHTFAGNPLAAAAALASLELFDQAEFFDDLNVKAAYLRDRLGTLQRFSHVADIRTCGMMAALELRSPSVASGSPDARGLTNAVCQHAMNQGVWLRPLGAVLPIVPPLSITPEEIDVLVAALDAALSTV